VEICKKFSRKCGVFLSSGDFPSLMNLPITSHDLELTTFPCLVDISSIDFDIGFRNGKC
jgi:hypothetical protein